MHQQLAMKSQSQCYHALSPITRGRPRPSGSTIPLLHFHSPSSESLLGRFCFPLSLIQSSSSHNTFGSRRVSLHKPTSMVWENTPIHSAFRQTTQHLPSGLATQLVFRPGRTCMEITPCTLSTVRQVLMVFSSSTRMGWTSRLRTMDLVALL